MSEESEYINILYKGVLGREAEPEGLKYWTELLTSGLIQPYEIYQNLLETPEKKRIDLGNGPSNDLGNVKAMQGTAYHAPTELSLRPNKLRRVLIVGSCLSEYWLHVFSRIPSGCPCDHVLINNVSDLPEQPPRPIEDYDFQILQLSLRAIVPETAFFKLDYQNEKAYRELFIQAKERLAIFLAQGLSWNSKQGILTFVANFFSPQQNPMGRLFPRYDYRNPVYFIEQLNQALEQELQFFKQAHFLDANAISYIYGQKQSRDDALWMSLHGSLLSDWDYQFDKNRIEPLQPAHFYFRNKADEYVEALWLEILAMYRSIQQKDPIKLVVFDLDNTLWRGVAAEGALDGNENRIEGWPHGIIEAIYWLKKRSILVALNSKNEEATIRRLWPEITQGHLDFDIFATVKINWQSKAENMQVILDELSLLAQNVLFIDDNPVERALIKESFPEIRILGANPYLIRRLLLWSPELQVAKLSDESSRRTEMVQAQIKRESERKKLSQPEFLASLNLKMKGHRMNSAAHPQFFRALELINKTNQFNTTGLRWTEAMAVNHFLKGGLFYTFEVNDKYTNYGLVAVVIVSGPQIKQLVMSCRVIGLEIELAIVAQLCRRFLTQGLSEISAEFKNTEANYPARNLFERCGFSAVQGGWYKFVTSDPKLPAHIQLLDSFEFAMT